MRNTLSSIIIIVLLVTGIIFFSSVYVVPEHQQVVITQFGEPKGDPKTDPGLYFKIPFIQNTHYFEKRILEWDGDPNRIPTEDKRYIWIDTTARWRIVDPLKFMQTVYNEPGAHQRLDGALDGTTRNVIGGKNLIEVIRSSNRILSVVDEEKVEELFDEGTQLYDRIPEDSGRDALRASILEQARPKVEKYGIELVDLRIKRVNYESRVRKSVFNRMISERKEVADKFRSQGEAEKARIEGLKEKEFKRISSEAYREAQVIRGKADAEAIKIYADAFNKDPEFYSFIETLRTYRKSLNNNTTLVLGTENEYFDYLKSVTS